MAAVCTNYDPIESLVTQAMKFVIETTSDTTTVPTFYGGPDIPADEMTLSIDHIREQLLSLLTPQDLFNCRRLNRVWNSYATVELQERFEVKCTIKKRTLKKYLALLQKHQEMFPCLPLPIFRKYSFEKNTLYILSDPTLQQFLRTYGYFIYDLSLIQDVRFCSSFDQPPKEKKVMDHVRSLLAHSAPNLSSLRMDQMRFRVDWNENSSDPGQKSSRPLRTTDPEFAEINSIPDTDKNENLKYFSFNSISGKIFELAVQLAPNLKEIKVRSDREGGVWGGGPYEYFIRPLNRLRFCKDIQYNMDSSELFKRFADLAHKGDLKLRQFSFMFGRQNPSYDTPWLSPIFVDAYDDDDVDAVNRILASSWDSLETIRWKWMKPVPGLKWPEVMPNVTRIDLGPHHHALEDGLLVFPPDFVWSTTFPKLRELNFCEIIESSGFPQLLQCFKSQCIESVEEVHVLAKPSEELERDATALANLELLRRLFPSAQVLF